jgi:hypothetical protein
MRAWFHIGGLPITGISKLFLVSEDVARRIVRGKTYQLAGGYGL